MKTETEQNSLGQPWNLGSDIRPVRRHDTAVILHLFYPDMWAEFQTYLANLGQAFDLYVTIPREVSVPEGLIQSSFPDAQVYFCENRGRDVAPFLAVFSAISDLGYKYICKIHSKASLHVKHGIEWRQDMLRKLLGSAQNIAAIKQALDQNPSWGIVAPRGHVTPQEYFWQGNAAHVLKLAHAAGISIDRTEFNFVAGSMFWFKPEALALMLKAPVSLEDFEPERGQQDGTLAHAFERFFGLVSAAAGYEIVESDGQAVRPTEISIHFQLLYEAYEKHRTVTEQRIRKLQDRLIERENGPVGSQRVVPRHLLLSLRELGRRLLAVSEPGRETGEESVRTRELPALLVRAYRISRDAAFIRRSGLFDESWYVAHNPDVAASHSDPARHYLLIGGFDGRDPGPEFDSRGYLDAYEDVRAAGTNPLLHFLRHGRNEGRLAQPVPIRVTEHQPAPPVHKERTGVSRRPNPLQSLIEKILRALRSLYRRLPFSAKLRFKLMGVAHRFFPGPYRYYKKATSKLGSQTYSAYRSARSFAQDGSPDARDAHETNLDFCAWLLELKRPELESRLLPPAWDVEEIGEVPVDQQEAERGDAAADPVRFAILLMVNDAPAHFLRNAIASVRRQSYRDWQLDICVTETGQWDADVLAMRFKTAEPRIRTRLLSGGGTSSELADAIAASEGSYTVLLSAYDELRPGALRRAANAIASSTCDLVYSCGDEPPTGSEDDEIQSAQPASENRVVDEHFAFRQFIAWRKTFLLQVLGDPTGGDEQVLTRLRAALPAFQPTMTAQVLPEPGYLFREVPGRLAAHLAMAEGHYELRISSVPLRVVMDAYLLDRNVSGTERYLSELLRALSDLRHQANLRLSALVTSRPKFKIDGVQFITSSRLDAIRNSHVYHKAFPAADGVNLAEMGLAHSVVFTPLDLILYTNQDYFPSPDDYYHYRQIMLSAARLSDRIISISNHGKMEIEKYLGIPGSKVQPIYLGVRPDHFQSDAGAVEALKDLKIPQNYFLYVGTDYPHKNLVKLLQAYQLMRSEVRSVDLVVIGLNYYVHPQPELAPLLHRMLNHVHRLGHVNDDVLPMLYRHATALVYPSLYEGFGLPLLEAMLCGTPVVASDATSIPEVTGQDAALLVDGRDEKQIAAAMLQILRDDQLRSRLVEAGYRRAAEFTWERTARQTIRLYGDAVRAALSAPPQEEARRKLEIIGELRSPAPAILIYSHVRFYPPAAGNEQRLYRMVKYLKKLGYRTLMLVNPMSETASLDREALKAIYQYVDYYEELGQVAVDDHDQPGGNSPVGREKILERWRPTESAFCPDAAMSRARSLIEQYSPKVLLAEYIWSSRIFAVAKPDMLKIIDTIDMFSHKNANVVKFGIQDTLSATPAEELAFVNRSDVVIAIQDSEAAGFRDLHPSCEVITAGVDLDVPEPAVAPGAQRSAPLVLMVGSGNHINIHCTQEFLEQAWPIIRQRVPECRLKIIGKVCDSLSTADPRVELISYVKDLEPVYEAATVVVNPVYAGTGLKVKSVEAIGHGKPLVSWPEGVVGLAAAAVDPFVVIHSWPELAERVAELALEPEKRRALEQAALAYARTSFTDKAIYRQLADRLDTFCHRKLHVLCLYLRYGTDDYPHAMADLQAWQAAKMGEMDVTTWIIDNKIQHEFDGSDLDTGFRLLSGDNAQWEFSGLQKILAEHRAELESYDVIHFVTSAFNTLYTGYLDHFSAENLQFVAHRKICLGHLDSYDKPVQLEGKTSQSWIRTCFFFTSPETIYSIPGAVSFTQPAQFFDADGSFRRNGHLSDNYQDYISRWLNGAAIQGVAWHDRTLDPAMFMRKALAILNENMLSQQLREAGIDLVDFYWLVNNGEKMRSSWSYPVPGWAEQISIRGAGPLATAPSP